MLSIWTSLKICRLVKSLRYFLQRYISFLDYVDSRPDCTFNAGKVKGPYREVYKIVWLDNDLIIVAEFIYHCPSLKSVSCLACHFLLHFDCLYDCL